MYVSVCRAVYFYAYASSKQFLNTVLASDTALVHIISAACAGGTLPAIFIPVLPVHLP